ncbi:MAG TPA: TonB-dependent receptor [Caulobacteraceae bacterium]|jgi:iron complex outermembrane receptor protein
MARASLLLGATALISALGGSASAQTSPTQVQEIIVTAQRRATDVQKTPIALTATRQSTLDKSFVTEIAGLNAMVPSFESTRTSGFENIVTIRGVGSETPENDLTTQPGVSLFMDGVYIVNTISLSQALFDLDRVEVLRGPQGALYGQGSIGGAINLVSEQPRLGDFSGHADVSAGTYDLTRERAWLNIPIGDTFAARISVQRFDHEGFTRDLAIPGFREDDAHNSAIKAAIIWRPVSNFSATLTGQWYRADENGQAQKNIRDPEPSAWEIFQDYPSLNELTSQLYHLNLQYDAPWFSVRSVSGYQQMRSVLREDSSRSAISLLDATGTCPPFNGTPICYDDVGGWDTNLRSYNEEFDILSKTGGRFEWIAGAFLLGQTSRQFVAEFEGGANPNPSDTQILPDIETHPPGNLAYGNDSLVRRQSYSAFVQALWRITDRLRLTLGGRLNYDHFTDDSANFSAFGFSHSDNAKTDHVPTWRAELDYDLAPGNMIYASAARGYKPGGVNGNNTAVVVPFTFEPETNTAFEIGSKNLFLDRALRFNAAAFYYDYKNMQYIEDDPFPFASGISNIPTVHVWGIEGEASYVGAGDRLHINGQISLEQGRVAGRYLTLDSTVVTTIESQPFPSPCAFGGGFNPACQSLAIASARDIEGNTPPAMPEVSGEIDASWRFDIPSGALTPRIQFVYRGAEWARIFNEPSLDRVPAYGVTNLEVEYRPTGSRFEASLAATNLLNVAGVNSQYTDPFGTGQTSRQYIPPRQVILTLGYSF